MDGQSGEAETSSGLLDLAVYYSPLLALPGLTLMQRLFICLPLLLVGCADNSGNSSESRADLESTPHREEQQNPNHVAVVVHDENFEELVLKSELPVLVDFWAPHCAPCLKVAPAIEQLARRYKGRAVVAKVNTENSPELFDKFVPQFIPHFAYFKAGEMVDQQEGLPSPDVDASVAVLEMKLKALIPEILEDEQPEAPVSPRAEDVSESNTAADTPVLE